MTGGEWIQAGPAVDLAGPEEAPPAGDPRRHSAERGHPGKARGCPIPEDRWSFPILGSLPSPRE